MTKTSRWVDELPTHADERGLLAAGLRAHSPAGSAARGWQALAATLGTATATAALTSNAVATTATKTATLASTTVAAKATVGGLGVSLVAKSVAIGFAVGMGTIGTVTVVERVSHRPSTAAAVATNPMALPTRPTATQSVVMPPPVVEPAAKAELVEVPAPKSTTVRAGSPLVTPEPRSTSLGEQAREMAQIKQLIDGGAAAEAVRRLEASFRQDVYTALAEERDALYIQALEKAQRGAKAKSLATQFVARYPNSPHVEKMRALFATE